MRMGKPGGAGATSRVAHWLADGQARTLAAILLPAFVLACRPLSVFLQSSQEFSVPPATVLVHCLQLFALASAWLAVPAVLLSGHATRALGRTYTVLLLAAAVALWLQGYFFLWPYGPLDGRPLDFASFTWQGWFEVLAWAGVFALFLKLRHRVLAATGALWLVLAGSVLAGLLSAYAALPPTPWQRQYHASLDTFYTFSRTRNVLVVTYDSARGDVFEELLEGMTAQEKELFEGFTFFRNTTGAFNGTIPAVSGILTGRTYDFARPRTAAFEEMFSSPGSVPLALKRAGFVSEVYPYSLPSVHLSPAIADNIVPKAEASDSEAAQARRSDVAKLALVTRFNFTPHFLKQAVFDASDLYVGARTAPVGGGRRQAGDDEASLPGTLLGLIAHERAQIAGFRDRMAFRDEPVFKYLHFHGGHPPFFHDEAFQGRRLPTTMDSYRRQYKGALLLTTRALVESLKKAGVYDRTMLVIIGDHGLHVDDQDGEPEVRRRVMDTLRPLLLVKPFGAAAAPVRTSSAPVSLFDVPATVLQAVRLPAPADGRSVFGVKEGERRPRHAYSLALSPEDPAAAESGALVYRVDGDVADPAAWKLEPAMLRLRQGQVAVPAHELADAEAALGAFLRNMNRFAIED